jgi:geranylgeranyl reductase family protein
VQIPSTCDVLIVGAGPAGSAAATMLARAGADVVVVDQRSFPREKVCGDGLISDALGALDVLGLRRRVLDQAVESNELRVFAPSGRYVSIRSRFACVPRERLDALLLHNAIDAGARFVEGVTAAGAIRNSHVSGARLIASGRSVDVGARVTLLATGANATTLEAFGLDVAKKPMGVAGRAYFEAPPALAASFQHLTIAYDKDWCPGYGWIFPGPSRRFNIGVGLFAGGRDSSRLREFWDVFRARFAPAAEIIAASRQLTAFRGAPLRTGLTGARFGDRGLLVIGEAAAMTYPATGEGIGKAMESGLLAAELVADSLAGRTPIDQVHSVYGDEFTRRFAPRYRAYRVAQRWAAWPVLLNLLARRADAGRFVREELEALVDERGDASALFSGRGLLTALVR